MSFWINKQLIIITFLGMLLTQAGLKASSFFDDEKPCQGKTQNRQKKVGKSPSKESDKKRTFGKRDSQKSIFQFFDSSKRPKKEEPVSSNTSFSSSTTTNDSLIDLTEGAEDKENDPSPMMEQTNYSKATPEEISTFNGYFTPLKAAKKALQTVAPVQPQAPKASPEEIAKFNKLFYKDYEVIKAKKLAEPWEFSQNGHPFKKFSPLETPRGKPQMIVITTWTNGIIFKYSAFINGTSLGHWFPDQDSVKRAAINIIYNNK